jgi:PAS domain S-box-containing protein
MKLTNFKSPYLIVFILTSIILSTLTVFFFNSKEKYISKKLVEHTHQVIRSSNDLSLDLINHQASIRGYIITHDTRFLEAYLTSLPNIKKHFSELRIIVKDNLRQQNRLDTLETLIIQRTELSKKTILQIKDLSLNKNLEVSYSEEGKKIIDKAKVLLANFVDEEYDLLIQRKAIDTIEDDKQFSLFIILFSTSFFILILSILNIRKYVKTVIRSQHEKADLEQKAIKLKSEKDNAIALMEQIKNYKYALDESSIVAITNQKGIITYVNDNFCKISKYSIEELVGQDHRIINSGHHPKQFIKDLWSTISNGQVWKGDLKNKAKDGTIYWVDTTIVPFLNSEGKPHQYIAIRSDITERKKGEALIKKINEDLEQKAIQLESKKELAEDNEQKSLRAIESKQQFLANMSHEIRTPMSAIIGFSKVVLKTDLTEKQREYITAIKTSSDALLVLINDILDLAKVDAGKMIFEQTAFVMESDILAMLNLFDLKIQEKNLTLIKEYDNRIPKVLIGDSVRLNQIILNLMSNAIKFTSKGTITISISLIDETEENVTIQFEVTDTGIGLVENMIPSLFESFQQATSSTAREYGGTGLGLAIVKQLVEQQGGSINVKSKLNEGSTFSFVLNFQKSNGKIKNESLIPKLNQEINIIKVLAVEDMPLNQMLLKIILDDFGFERDFAENGKVAIEKLQANSYDIILMDIQMPVMGGLEATEYIRNKMHSKIPIIALTADVTIEDLEKTKAIGMNDFVSKPIDEQLLYNKIVALVVKAS